MAEGGWDTASELKFLDMLALRPQTRFGDSKRVVNTDTALRNYARSVFTRTKWGAIDKKQIAIWLQRHGYLGGYHATSN